MNPTSSPPPSADDDAWLERALRQPDANDHYIDDAGFTARVVRALPRRAPVQRRRAWLIAGATVLGCGIAGGIAVPAVGDAVTRVDFTPLTQLTLAPNSLPLAVLAASLLIAGGSAYWALARRN